jgi:diaminopimelate decarboxylase
MRAWRVRDGCLEVGGLSLIPLAQRVGRTPFYAYDRGQLKHRIDELREHLPREVQLHYAMKANPMPALVGFMTTLVDGLDVASAGELAVALDAGAPPSDISFAGPAKQESELRQAIAAGILVNVESRREVALLAALSNALHLPARVAVRINPDFELKSSGMRMSGGAKQFGIDAERVPEVLAEIRQAGLAFEGFHVFCGSQNLSAHAICEAQARSVELALRLADYVPSGVCTINIGGGFGIPYFPGEKPLELAPIGTQLHALVDRVRHHLPGARLVIELGRYLVGEAGVYVCSVVDRKVSRGQVFLVTDGGLHHHLSASGNFGQVLRKNYPVVIGNRMNASRREVASVVGPLCTPLDLLADRVDLAEAVPGDLVVVFQSGAYGATASPQRFLSHPPPREALV